MRFFIATSILAALASSACSAAADTEGLRTDATALDHVSHKSVHRRTATIQDYPWKGAGSCRDANDNAYPSYYSEVFPAGLFDHECIEWCLQNSAGLRGVQVYRDAQSNGQCYCLYDHPFPSGLTFSPAHVNTNSTGTGSGVINQVSEADDWVCYAAPVTSSSNPFKCVPEGQKIKVQSNTGKPLQMREVRVYSDSVNVAIGKTATQSEDVSWSSSNTADKAVDNTWGTWSSTDWGCQWWQVDLGATYSIDKIIIINRKVKSCFLSHATVSVLDGDGNWIESTTTRDTCDKGWVVPKLPKSGEYCPSSAPSAMPSSQPSGLPTGTPSDSPSDSPTVTPSDSPSDSPSGTPSDSPSGSPSGTPSDSLSNSPSYSPSVLGV